MTSSLRAARRVAVTGGELDVVEWGSGPPLICLHGLGGGWHFFEPLGAALGRRCRVIACDMPGAGLSPAGPVFSFRHAAGVLADLIRREGWPDVVLLGHSMGTIVALETIRQTRGLVAGLVVVGGLPEPLPASRVRLRDRAARVRASGMAGLGAEAVEANLAGSTREEQPALCALFGRLFERQSASGYADAAEALAEWEAPPLPPLDAVRTFAITGEEDRYAPPAAVREFAARVTAEPVTVLPRCGHVPFLEDPRAFAAALMPALDAIWGSELAGC